jgi:hypothetical protein
MQTVERKFIAYKYIKGKKNIRQLLDNYNRVHRLTVHTGNIKHQTTNEQETFLLVLLFSLLTTAENLTSVCKRHLDFLCIL